MKVTIYNEDKYLTGNPEALNRFSKILEDREKIWDAEKAIYADTIKKYNYFVDELAILIRELGFSSSIECSLILSYLIKNGFLSENLTFNEQALEEENELSCSFGATIITGAGCCRNFVSMHKDVFERLGLSFKSLYCYIGNNAFNRAANSHANHVVSLIEYRGNYYAIDLYNNDRLYHFKNALVLKEISFAPSSQLRYKPYYELTMGEASLEDIKSTLEKNEKISQLKPINAFDYDDKMRIETQNRLRRKEKGFYVFHEETKTLKKSIATAINRIKDK